MRLLCGAGSFSVAASRPCTRRIARNPRPLGVRVASLSGRGVEASPVSTSASQQQEEVRVLRYPDGFERRIIYPADDIVDESAVDELEHWSLYTQSDEDEAAGWNECGLAGSACAIADPDPLIEELAALQQRHNNSSSSNLVDRVRGSYQILSGSPWLLPRPLFVLAQEQLTTGQATMYTLQTRVQQELVQDELAMVLKQPHLSSALSFSKMKDGVLAFDRAEDAARYATCLEADLPGEVEVMEVDSRQLFLMTGDAEAVVVYLPWSEFTPMPQQLAAALREGEQAGSAGR